MAVSRRLRYEIFRRDDFQCRYCGAKPPETEITVDHVKPVALGGTDVPENLVTACRACNAGKTSVQPDSPHVADVAKDALRWKNAMEQSIRWHRIGEQVLADCVAEIDAWWQKWKFTESGEPIPRPPDWPDTIERFVNLGLPVETMQGHIDRSMRKPKLRSDDIWTYFCGCCWRTMDELQEQTKRSLEIEDAENGP